MFERVTVVGRDIPQESGQKKDEIHVGMEGNGKNEDEAAACVELPSRLRAACDFLAGMLCCFKAVLLDDLTYSIDGFLASFLSIAAPIDQTMTHCSMNTGGASTFTFATHYYYLGSSGSHPRVNKPGSEERCRPKRSFSPSVSSLWPSEPYM